MSSENRIALRTLVEAEGKAVAVFNIATPFILKQVRGRIALLVFLVYRPARAMMNSSTEMAVTEGRVQMEVFAALSMDLAVAAETEGDTIAAMLSRHNAASAYGLLGVTVEQNRLNAEIYVALLEPIAGEEALSDDERFVMNKAFFGLLENDEKFAVNVPLVQWCDRVNMRHKVHKRGVFSNVLFKNFIKRLL